ncbi:hypothetical protein SESBI_02411 [Sesbania bispinosa]|nr:hypothetical protein SESBI_02411 [Sesbania bispinosa]
MGQIILMISPKSRTFKRRKERSMQLALETTHPKPYPITPSNNPHHTPYHPFIHTPTHPILQTSTILTREEHPKLGTPHLHKLTMFPFPTSYRPSKIHPISQEKRVKIDPVPIPYSDLYDTLLQQHLVAPEVPQPVSNPPPKWYNPAEACKYHMGAPGHSIEKCLTFKLRVQRLRDAGQLFFEEGEGKSTGTSIDKDPLLKH